MQIKRRNLINSILFANLIAIVIYLVYYFVMQIKSEQIIEYSKPFLLAFGINILNLILAMSLFSISQNKNNRTFLILNLGGMVFRIFLLIVFVAIFYNFLNIDKVAFIFTFFIFYFIYLIIEIRFYSKKNTINYGVRRS